MRFVWLGLGFFGEILRRNSYQEQEMLCQFHQPSFFYLYQITEALAGFIRERLT